MQLELGSEPNPSTFAMILAKLGVDAEEPEVKIRICCDNVGTISVETTPPTNPTAAAQIQEHVLDCGIPDLVPGCEYILRSHRNRVFSLTIDGDEQPDDHPVLLALLEQGLPNMIAIWRVTLQQGISEALKAERSLLRNLFAGVEMYFRNISHQGCHDLLRPHGDLSNKVELLSEATRGQLDRVNVAMPSNPHLRAVSDLLKLLIAYSMEGVQHDVLEKLRREWRSSAEAIEDYLQETTGIIGTDSTGRLIYATQDNQLEDRSG